MFTTLRRALCRMSLGALLGWSAVAPADEIRWLGGTGNWNDPNYWSGGVLPTQLDIALIDGGLVQIPSSVLLDSTAAVMGLLIDPNDELHVGADGELRIGWGPAVLVNAGTLFLDGGNLQTWDSVQLTGGGLLALQYPAQLVIIRPLTNVDNTIAGSGSITAHSSLPFVNAAVIEADDPAQELTIDCGDVRNSGTLRARNGATLSVGYIENQNGSLQAEDGSTIELDGWVIGGQLTANGSGRFEIPDMYYVLLQDVSNAAPLQIESGATLQLNGSAFENRGTVSAQGVVSPAIINIFGGPLSLSGGGTLALLNSCGLYTILGGGPLVNQDNLIHGGGWIQPALENHATVRADANDPLTLGGSNAGLLEAANGGILALANIENTNGRIAAQDRSVVQVAESILGGRLESYGSGRIETAAYASVLFRDLENHAAVHVGNGGHLLLDGNGLQNSGAISVVCTDLPPTLEFLTGPFVLTGGGAVELGACPGMGTFMLVGAGLLINEDNLIHGSGIIDLPLENHATVRADASEPLVLLPYLSNSGRIEAVHNARLELGDLDNHNGVLAAQEQSVVALSGTIDGGRLEASGTGRFDVAANAALRDVENRAPLHVLDWAQLRLEGGGLRNAGTLTAVCDSGSPRIEVPGGPFVLDGGGNVELGVCPGTGMFMLTGAGPLINEDNLIHGSGVIAVALENHAVVRADESEPLSLWTNVRNSGRLEAVQSARLELGDLDNHAGIIAAQDQAVVALGGITDGGRLEASAAGQFEVTAGLAAALRDVENFAPLRVRDSAALRLEGSGLRNAGTITAVYENGTPSIEIPGGPFMLDGGGSIELGARPGMGTFMLVGTGALINEDNLIHGSGIINIALENHATVRADTSEPLGLWSQVSNSGQIEAIQNAELQLGDLENPNGVVAARDQAVVAIGDADNDFGQIIARNNGLVLLSGVLAGGRLDATESGRVEIPAGQTATLRDVQNSAPVKVYDGAMLRLEGSELRNTGTISAFCEESLAVIEFPQAPFTLSGGGTIEIGVCPDMGGFVMRGPGPVVNIDHLIHGSGMIEPPLENLGVLRADAAEPLLLAQPAVNHGRFEAADGGTLVLGVVDNSNGVITALDGSVVELGDSLRGGSLAAEGSGYARVPDNFTLRLRDVQITAPLQFGARSFTMIEGEVRNTQPWTIAGAGLHVRTGALLHARDVELKTAGGFPAALFVPGILEATDLRFTSPQMQVNVAGGITLGGDFDSCLARDQSYWLWLPQAPLTFEAAAGAGASAGRSTSVWQLLEAADQDLGPTGSATFGFGPIGLGSGAHAALVDRRDNSGNSQRGRGGRSGVRERSCARAGRRAQLERAAPVRRGPGHRARAIRPGRGDRHADAAGSVT